MLEMLDRKSTRLNSSHTVIYTLSLHDALPISFYIAPPHPLAPRHPDPYPPSPPARSSPRIIHARNARSEEHTSELQSHRDLHSFPTRRSSDLFLYRATTSFSPSASRSVSTFAPRALFTADNSCSKC